ncbi:MAG: WD40 repeat domain-containing protein [Aggregatilineales bacterium]
MNHKHTPLKRSILLACFVVGLGMYRPAVEVQGSTAPYLYYFDYDHTSFVVERADGTDSRLLGAGLMPPGTDSAAGATWSPSGKWFAWTATQLISFPDSQMMCGLGYDPFVISADGKHQLQVLKAMHRVNMAWSPVEDVLFVAGFVDPPRIGAKARTWALYLVDTQTGKLINTFSDVDTFAVSANFSPDGKLLAISSPWHSVQIVNVSTGHVLLILPIDGLGTTLSPDGKLLAVASSWTIQFWNMSKLIG